MLLYRGVDEFDAIRRKTNDKDGERAEHGGPRAKGPPCVGSTGDPVMWAPSEGPVLS